MRAYYKSMPFKILIQSIEKNYNFKGKGSVTEVPFCVLQA